MTDGPSDLSGKRIGLLTASVSRLGGGVFEAVVNQAELVRRCGGEAVVIGLEDRHSADDRARFAPSTVITAPVSGPPMIGYAPALVTLLLEANLDLLHLHGIWMYPSHAATRWAKRTRRPYIVSPHGMLDPWITARGRLKKTIAREAYERASWRQASVLHALTAREAGDIAHECARTDTVVIANAGPPPAPAAAAPRPPHFVYLGRIHPKKNIAALIAAWSQNAERLARSDARLTIAGWGEDDDVTEFKVMLAGAPPTVAFAGPVYGERKDALLREARFLVLPSHSEGLPMVILEAWAKGTPTLMTAECNLPEGLAAGAAIECGYDAGAIGPQLVRAAEMPAEEWLAMSRAAHGLAAGPFAPETIEARWARCYADLIATTTAPGGDAR